jgi:hypothetical protein
MQLNAINGGTTTGTRGGSRKIPLTSLLTRLASRH